MTNTPEQIKNSFIQENQVLLKRGNLNITVLDALVAIKNINDVFACPFIEKKTRVSFLNSFKKAKRLRREVTLWTQGLTHPLIACDETSGHPFDATPRYGLGFNVGPDRTVHLMTKMLNGIKYFNEAASLVC